MTYLASDARNPEFLGAHDPDARLAVQFYERPLLQEFKSEQAQRPIYENVVFVKIFTPGNELNIIDTIARQEHKNRFPKQWAAFQNRQDGGGKFIGTPITEWPRINAAQAEELKALKFFTVESVANASDAQLQGIGMIAGTSAFTFRDEAKRFLMVAEAAAQLTEAERKQKEADEKLEAANAEILRQREQHAKDMEEMRAQMKQLMEATAQAAQRRPGRPAKEAE
jgi:hypothetical protein